MSNHCVYSDDFDPSQVTILGGPYSTPSGCVDNFCVCSGVDCGPSGIDPVTCNCVPIEVYDPPSGVFDPPQLDCSGLDAGISTTINGYAYYFDSPTSVTIAGESLTSPCHGGHWCDRAEFIPKLKFSDNTEISGGNINLDNGSGGGDRSDTFSFVLTGKDSSVVTSGTDITLECNETNNNCHYGITWIVLTMKDANTNTEKVLFNDCVVPGSLDPIGIECVEDNCDELSSYLFSSAITSGDLYYATQRAQDNHPTGEFTWNAGYPSILGTKDSDWFIITTLEHARYTTSSGGTDTKKERYRYATQILFCSGNVLYDVTGQAVESGIPFYWPINCGFDIGQVGTNVYTSFCYNEVCTSTTSSYNFLCSGTPDFYYNTRLLGGGQW